RSQMRAAETEPVCAPYAYTLISDRILLKYNIFRRCLMATLAQMIDDYLAGPSTLRKAVAGMTRQQLLARPVAGKWSTVEVVCPLADFDPILPDRIKRIIAEERPTLIGADENKFAAKLAYQDRDLDEELDIIDRARRQLARILLMLPAEA